MLKKTIALAMAVGAVGAVGMPGVAWGEWGHKGEVIQENYTIGSLGLTGSVRFQGGLGGIECQVTVGTLLEPGTTGTLSTFEPDPLSSGTSTNRCKGIGGVSPCQIHQFEPTGLPWTIHTASATTISVTTGTLNTSLTGGIFCLFKQVQLTETTLTWTVDNANAVSEVTLSGTAQSDLQTNNGTVDKEQVTLSGVLQVTGSSSKTYEI